MGHSFLFFFYSVIGLLSSVAFGLFEEQAGEYDWKIESIGVIQQSFNKDEKTFVATADSVIAGLNSIDGSLNWRATLPAGTFIHHIISGKTPSGSTDIFSLTSTKVDSEDASDDQYQLLLSSWSSEVGTLRWQLSLGSKNLGLTDLVFDSSRYLITALSGNSIDVATVRGNLLWHWNPSSSEDSQFISNAQNGKELIISQLLLPAKNVQKNETPSPTRIAVGCFADITNGKVSEKHSSSPSSLISFVPKESANLLTKCGNTAVLSIVLPTKLTVQSAKSYKSADILLKVFPALPDVAATSLRGAISTDDSEPYTANDIIFGMSTNSNNKSKAQSLNLSSNMVTSYDMPVAEVTTPTSGASYLLSRPDNLFAPVFVFCDSISCSSFFLSNMEQKNHLTLLAECGGMGSVLGVERVPSGGSLGQAISCAKKSVRIITKSGSIEKDVCVASGTCTGTETVLTVTASSLESGTLVHSVLSSTLPSNISPSSVLFISTHKTPSELTALVVYSSLLTTVYSALPSSTSTESEKWRREESLSHVKQALVVEDSRHFIHKDGEADAVPAFLERLMMQFDDLKQTIVDLEVSLESLPDILYQHSVTGFGIFPASATPSPLRMFPAVVDVGFGIDSAAQKRRKVKNEVFPLKDRVKKARLFGFNKLALCLSSLISLDGPAPKVQGPSSLGALVKPPQSGFSGAGLKITGLDLLTGEIIWTLEPSLESGEKISMGETCENLGCDEVIFARLVTVHSSPLGSEATLLVSIKSGATYSWHFDASSGLIQPTPGLLGVSGAVRGPLVGVFSLEKDAENHKGNSQYMLLHSADGKFSASSYPPHKPAHNISAAHVLPGTYAHNLDRITGLLSTFEISPSHEGVPVSTARFPGPLASVSYPYFDDVMDSRFTVIGDQSILMKYVNPHTVLITYFSDESSGKSSESASKGEGRPLYAALVDTVSSKILHRLLLSKTASTPVHSLLVENHLIITYWNAKAKRTELSSTALYEGTVDVFGLSPLSYFSALPQQIRDANFSSFTSPVPLGIQRTYVIPRAVTSLHHTVTSRGGQLYSLDHRMIHPRRPFGPPTQGEKEEGLAQYNPFIPVIPQHAVTLDTRIAGDAQHIVTSPVRLESTSLVLVYGGLDMFFSRLSPSQGFDVLASDFNHPLLIFLLLVLALGVLALKRVHTTKTLKQSWA